MKIISVPDYRLEVFRWYVRNQLPRTQGTEMMAMALMEDSNVYHLIAINERDLIRAAVSYNLYHNRLHIFNLGSMGNGLGSYLMDYLEVLARVRGVPVTCLSLPSSRGFWLHRGYRITKKPKSDRSMTPMKLSPA